MTIEDPEPIEVKINQILRYEDKLDQTERDIVEEFMDQQESERTKDQLDEIEEIWERVT